RLFVPAPEMAWSPDAVVGIADTVAATAVFKKSLRFAIVLRYISQPHACLPKRSGTPQSYSRTASGTGGLATCPMREFKCGTKQVQHTRISETNLTALYDLAWHRMQSESN